MIKSTLFPKTVLQQFLIQYRRTPLACGYSPSELLNGRQIRTAIDFLIPSTAHQAQGYQCKQTTKAAEGRTKERSSKQYKVGVPTGHCNQSVWNSKCCYHGLSEGTYVAQTRGTALSKIHLRGG